MSPQSSVTHFDKQIIYAIFRGKMITILSGKIAIPTLPVSQKITNGCWDEADEPFLNF
jgi:hypothetical protein